MESELLELDLTSEETGPKPTRSLRVRGSPLASPAVQLRRLDEVVGAGFDEHMAAAGLRELRAGAIEIFQINLGKLCNMTCRHCHVDAGPDRTDAIMRRETIEACLRALDKTTAHTVDITGGAPELHPDFRYLVEQAVARGKHVIDRCNLTILLVQKFAGLPEWLAAQGVEIVASLPHFRPRNTDAQRGDGTFERSIEALRRLNRAGYGQGDPKRRLTLMSNPAGAFLAANQASLEQEFKTALRRDHGVTFDRLFVLNNMPISRYLEWLDASGNTEAYLERLVSAFNPAATAGLMCKNTLSVSWDGRIFDCDFNQMLDLPAVPDGGAPGIETFEPARYTGRRIVTRAHCFGCTAGGGSSCGGATS